MNKSRLGESAPCLFPQLGANARAQKRPMTVKVSLGHAQQLQQLSGETLSGTLRAAWAVLLQCYTDSGNVCFGYQETGHMGGGDISTIPIVHMAFGEDTSLAQLVELANRTHATVPSGEFRRRMCNTVVQLRTPPRPGTGNGNAPATRPMGILFPDACRLRLLAKQVNGSLSLFLEWWISDMSMDQAIGVASTLDKILGYALTCVDLRVDELDCFSEIHKKQVLEFNGSPLHRVDRCVHEVIQDQVLQKPDAEAVCAWDGSFTYEELDCLSSRLAYKLLQLGVGPEVKVPLCFDKSKWTIVATLAVFKAGGAFVPLDPSHPIPRLQGLVEDVGASILLCSSHHAERVASVAETVLPVDWDVVDRLPACLDAAGHTSRCEPANTAYLLFTSGSTGKPKGTIVQHAAYCSSAKAHAPALRMDENSRVLQFAAHTFDSSLVEYLTPLMQGACVCIPSEEERLNSLVPAMNSMRVNHAILTPSFIGFIEPSSVPDLKDLVLAGEAMSQAHVALWSKINLINGYGPTESAVAAVVNSNVTPESDARDIGFPVGVHCWVVNPNDHDRLVPPACTGELVLEGPSLARGYLNNEEKTNEVFIYDPVWSRGPEKNTRRFYKTGDLVFYNSSQGSLSYVGRKDSQVKFHGQRIELGEIESHLNENPKIKHGLVHLPKVGHCKQRLVSVVSLSNNLQDTSTSTSTRLNLVTSAAKDAVVAEAREHMARKLPAYMVPSTWICVESLPVLTSRKLDRKSVAKWIDEITEETFQQISQTADSGDFSTESANNVETKLRQVWSHVLNLPTNKIGLNQSFLRLGGDSITAMTCMGQCKKIGLGFTVQEVLRSKSIKELAPLAKEVADAVEYHEDVDNTFDLSPIQRLHFQTRQEGEGHFNQSFFLRLSRYTREEDLRRAIEAMIDRHSMLRARFSQSGPSCPWQQRITMDISSSYRFRFHKIYTQEQTSPAIANSQNCLDAVNGPVFAVDLFDLDGEKQLLSMIGHHLVIDLVSWRVILEDLEELLLNPTNPSLAPKSLPFQTWSHMQKGNAQDLSLSKALPIDNVPEGNFAYWGMADQPNTYGNAACEGFEIDSSLTSAILTDCNTGLRTEPIEILVSALMHSFAQIFTDRAVPPIYNEGHGREPWDESIDISRTVGWFTTVYPVFVPVSGSDNLVDVTRRVKDVRRRVPGNGRPYFATRFLTQQGKEHFGHHNPMEMTFNYLGQYQQLEREGTILQPVNEMAGEAREAGETADFGCSTPRFGLFEISAVVVQGKMRFSFTFDRHMKHQASIRQWISQCQRALHRIAEEFVTIEHVTTSGDFPLLSLSDANLQTMISEKLPLFGVSSLAEVEDAYPCSPMQQGLLLSRTKDGAFYSVYGTYEVKARGSVAVDTNALSTAWKRVVQRHAALRTVFVEGLTSDGLYDQVVLKTVDAKPIFLQCSDESDVMKALDSQPRAAYDDYLPPHRFSICRMSTGKVFCRLEMSHAIMDGASISIIFQDLQAAYAGTLAEGRGPLYSDFIAYLKRQSLEAGVSFWKRYLDCVEPCHFPILNDGVSVEKELRTLRLVYNRLPALQAFCDTNGLTLSNAIHTAWGLTLKCYIGSEDTCFGYLSSERNVPIDGIDDAVGPLINMLVCRVNMPADMELINVLDQVQQDYMDSLPYKHTSLAEVQHALKLSDTALFNTCVSYRKLPPSQGSVEPSVSFSQYCPIHDPTEYPLSINIEAADTDVVIDLDYWTDSIADVQATNIANTFIQCLDNITENSQQHVGQLDNLSRRDNEQIWSWNARIPESIENCVHTVVEKQVELRGSSPAIHAWDGKFTYRELNDLASRLGHYLVALGVVPETYVPVCFDKSAYTVISMLGVLKAGGACVPLDATHPKAALETRVLDTGAQVVLASPERAAIFEDIVPYVVPVDRNLLNEVPAYDIAPCPDVEPYNPAFVIFTSGSTGKPKGVVLEHRAMVTSAEAHGSALGINPETRFLQFAAHTFDNSLEEMFTTLERGGCVCVPSEDDRFNNLARAINDLDANFMDLTPTVATFLQPSDVPKIRAMAVGGEAMTKKVQEIWGGAIPVHNQYGPSECSINATHNGRTGTIEDISNIGYSVGSVPWIVDPIDHDRLLPVGCVGELLIEGPIVARGYLNDPEKTSKSFVENPAWVSQDPNPRSTQTRRMYKTGDLVRYNSDGSMVYFGRKDNQVKLNGQRIELGEIEHHVKSNLPDNVQSAVQLVTVSGLKSLAAFICVQAAATSEDEIVVPMSPSTRSTAQELESAISLALPTYMVPTIFIAISRMPLTSSGKLDRKTLADLVQSMSEEKVATYRLGGAGGRQPSTEVEKALQKLWASVLSKPVDSIGADDSFFRHGGDSIGAMKLVVAARSEGMTLTVANVFQRPRLSDMAADGSNMSLLADGPNLSPSPLARKEQNIQPYSLLPEGIVVDDIVDEVASLCEVDLESVQNIYPCTPIQGGLVALSSRSPGAYVAQNIFKLPSNIDFERFRSAWQAVADAEVVLRTRIVFTEEFGFLQVVVDEPLEWHTVATIQEIDEKSRHLPTHDGGELCRYTIAGEGTRTPYFVWTAHHALYDGWSIPTLLDRVAACYKDPSSESQHARTTFPEFVEYIYGIDTTESDEFWKSRLEDITAVPFPQLPNPDYRVNPTSQLSNDMSLPKISARETTLASAIRASWALIVSLYSYSDDVVFGEIMTGRDAPVAGIEDMVGPTLTTVPTRIRIDRELTIAEYLKMVQDQMAQTMPFQFAGIQNIKRLSSEAAVACGFQNCLAITQDADESADGFWDMTTSGTAGTNFYTYPLTISCTLKQAKVSIEAYYDQTLISTWQVEKLLGQFETILERFLVDDHADTKLSDLDLLSRKELGVLRDLNKDSVELVDRCVHDIIHEKSRANPTSQAITSWDGNFTYHELDELSSALAHYLVDFGVTPNPETFIPLCFEKSAFTIVSMLAVLKAGGTFVPFDPEHPVSRLQDMANDLSAFLVLCSPKYQDLCETIAPQVVAIDLDLVMSLPSRRYSTQPVPTSNTAYIIFTSGTTGKPKGTIVEHRAFCSSASTYGPALLIKSTSRMLQFASYTFDASLIETLTVLMAGGCVCVPSELERMNDIPDFINRMDVNITILTPSFANLIRPEDVPTLKTLILGGEAMSKSHVETWAQNLALVNAYGPSETSVVALANNSMDLDSSPSNIGRRLDKCWVVDATNHNRLCPIGTVGELLVEGPTLARGYLNNPQKTSEAFVKDPKWAVSETGSAGRTMYRTGDLVKYAGDGSMNTIFVGRKDTQTKVRGQRLELDEVEHALSSDKSVRNILVLVPKDGPEAKKLVAVLSLQSISRSNGLSRDMEIVASRDATSEASAIRERLRGRLPAYMVPSRWIVVHELPLLPSGKLDRRQITHFVEKLDERRLRTTRRVPRVKKETPPAPDIDIARVIREAMAHILMLSIEDVEPESSFLHLGGDSISGMQVMARCRSRGIVLTVQNIVGSKSITDLATKANLSTKASPTSVIETSPVAVSKTEARTNPDIVAELRSAWGHSLKLPNDEVDLGSSFLNLGGDSISAMQVMARCRSRGIAITVQDIISSKSISELAAKSVPGARTRAAPKVEDEGPFNLSPIQLVYLQHVGENWQQFNQSMLMRVKKQMRTGALCHAFEQVIKAHPMLRARFRRHSGGSWGQRISSDIPGSYRFRAHNVLPRQIESLIEASQKALNIEQGPLIAFDLFTVANDEIQLSIVAHHLVIDVVSWRILLPDLDAALNNGFLNPHSSLAFDAWVRLQEESAQQDTSSRVIPVSSVREPDYSYWGMAGRQNIFGDVVNEDVELTASDTFQLLRACHDSGTDFVDVLLASILLSLRQEFSDRELFPAVFNEGHGRESWDSSIDLSSTIGWFTTLCPVLLPDNVAIDRDDAFANAVRFIRDFRGRCPGKGRSYFAYRTLTSDGRDRFEKHWPMEIVFNYLGQMQQGPQDGGFLQEIDGGQSVNTHSDIGSHVPRFALIDISAIVVDGSLKMSFGYNRHMKHIDGIQNWARRCRLLLANAEACLSPHTHGIDLAKAFPLLPLAFGGSTRLSEQLPGIGLSSFAEVENVYPCSPMQRGILISQLKNPEQYACNFVFEVRSSTGKEPVDVKRLEAAWQRVVQRHPSLRTVFIESISGAGLMDQLVLRHAPARVVYRETSNPADVQSVLSDLTPLDYSDKTPPHRLTICMAGHGKVYGKLETNHAISDGSSVPILLQDLSKAYEEGPSFSTLGPLYSDFIAHLQSHPEEEGVKYWKEYLSGIEPCILPALPDSPQPANGQAASYILRLNNGSQLHSFCREHALTPANVLQFVWGLVLRAYTGSDDICFGYVTSGRNVPVDRIDDAVGAFINMLICRLSLPDKATVSDVLGQTQHDWMRSMEYQSCSLADVQHELGLSDTNLFNTVFTFQRRGGHTVESNALSFESIGATDPNEFMMSINVEATDTSLDVDFGYSTATISGAQAENIAKCFEHVLCDMIDNQRKGRTVGELEFSSDHSCGQVLNWNHATPKVLTKCVHELIEQNALLRPRSTMAVHSWDSHLTYSELDAAASRLASHLTGLGVGPDVYVPVLFEKSAWTIVSYLAVLKAGGAFVPLDPAHPDSRLRGLIEDVGAELVLCSRIYHEKASRNAKIAFIVDQRAIEHLANRPSTPPMSTPKPSNAAYVIFTSGTTGKPKGTVIEHAAICTSAVAHAKALLMDSSSRVLQFASYTFDASITEIITALIVGACVCVPSDEDRVNDISRAIAKFQATWMLLTPSVLGTLTKERVPSIKVVVTGGEAMTAKILEDWRGGPAIVNAYGPTEASVVATASTKVNGDGVLVDENRFSIGRATGCRSWIVDSRNHNKLVPVGAVGELVVEGRTVARGYLNNPEKTADVFIESPDWTTDPRLQSTFQGDRMYRTGDLVRYNPDGSINYISRKDTQIKLNGQRIEIGEIEHHCKAGLPDQTQVAVGLLTPPDQPKVKTLAVYFDNCKGDTDDHTAIAKTDGSPADDLLLSMTDDIRARAKSLETYLATVMPSYMVPRLFVPVSKLPWSTSGKLDRNHLRDMVLDLSKESIKTYRLTNSTKRVTPASGTAGKLQKMWETVLGLRSGSVGTHDSFFRLGGDSLAAMQVTGLARSQGISLSFANIFKYPILVDMAKTCCASDNKTQAEVKPFSLLTGPVDTLVDETTNLCRLNKNDILDIYPPSSLQEGLIALSIKQPGAYVGHHVYRLPSKINVSKFKSAWQTVVNDLDILRTRVVHTSINFVQVVHKPKPIEWHSATDLDDLLAETTGLPAHNGAPLTKYTIVEDRKSSAPYFVWSIHHALYDGWSLPLVLRRVDKAYNKESSPVSNIPYSRFIQYLSAAGVNDSDVFWKSQLEDMSATIFPSTPPAATEAVSRTRNISHTTKISGDHPGGNVTIPTLIRAAWAMVVAGHTGTDDVCFGETLSGRNINVDDIMDIVGPTLATVPMRVQVDREATVMEFLQKVNQIIVDVAPHQHVGLQHIRRLDADTASACDFQNLLVIQASEKQSEDDFWIPENGGDAKDFFTHPLVLECKVAKSEVQSVLYHRENVVGHWNAQRLLDQFSFVLKQLAAASSNVNKTVNEIDIFSPEDQEIVGWWNRRTPFVRDECIHESFNKKVISRPNDTAVCDQEMEMTYGELHDYASRLAIHLTNVGVRPESLVPICLDKSVWTVVSILAVLIAGGAFVPLDPGHPASRHHEIVEEVGAKTILTSASYTNRFRHVVDEVVVVESKTVNSLAALGHSAQVSQRTDPSNTAYVIFTSGSTGRAKGVVIEHKAFSSASATFASAMHIKDGVRAFQFASLSFDVAVMEILTTLTLGGCVCMPSEDERLKDTAGAINRMNANWTFLTSSVANTIDPATVTSLQVLVCGGEAMSPDVVSQWADKVRLINAYGPSEASVIAVTNPSVSIDHDASSIGTGIQATLTWVLDIANHDKLAPLGSIGELALEGPTLAREYLNSPEKTAQAFINRPAWSTRFPGSNNSGRRVYKTGDLVRYNSNGTLTFLGRTDSQVKVNGQRMELGEIEHRLDIDPQIRQDLVLLPGDGLCKKRLVGLVSLKGFASNDSSTAASEVRVIEDDVLLKNAKKELTGVRKRISNQLPPFMIPQVWVILENIPLLSSGKLDRKQVSQWLDCVDNCTLERITWSEEETDNPSPVTGAVKILQEICSTVLNMPTEQVNVNESFLSLGGDSITAMSVMSRCRKEGITLSMHEVLRSKSLRDLADGNNSTLAADQGDESIHELFDLSPIQQIYFQAATRHAGQARFNQSFSLRITKPTTSKELKRAIEVIIDRHSMLRARFSQNHNGVWQQRITDDTHGSYRYREHRVNGLEGIPPFVVGSQRCLDIENGPIVAADFFETGDLGQVVFFVAHHLCVDMMSWRIILQDLQDILEQGSLVLDKPLSFQTWAIMQAERSKRQDAAKFNQADPPAPNTGYWGMGGVENTYRDVCLQTFTVDKRTTDLALGAANGAFKTEPVDLFLSAIVHSFSRIFSDREIPPVFNEAHGREPWDGGPDPSRTVGWFTSIYPISIPVDSARNEKDDVLCTLRKTKDMRRKIPANGSHYLAERLASKTQEGCRRSLEVPVEILFNYLGRMQHLEGEDSLLQQIDLASNEEDAKALGDVGPDTARLALFELSAVVVQDEIKFTFMFNRNMNRARDIYRWISECKHTLEESVQAMAHSAPEPTLSDYPLLPISYDGLTKLVKSGFPKAGISHRDEVEDIYPCSSIQEGILLSQLRNSDAYLFNAIFEAKSKDIYRKVDAQRLATAWQKVVNRHAALRTVFVDSFCRGSSFDQLVVKQADSGVISIQCDDSEAVERLNAIKLKDTNYKKCPKLPHQLTICVTTSGRVLVKTEINHAVIDGGSTGIMMRDLASAYENQLPDAPGPLYSDYIRFILNNSPEEETAFWTNYLHGVQPCYFPRSNKEINPQRRLSSVQMEFSHFAELQSICDRTNVTLANLMLGAWAIVLRSYTDSDDVCFGYLSAGRDAPVDGIQETIGVFINMLCCRVQFGRNSTLGSIFRKVQEDYIDSLPYQRCSLAKVQHEVGLAGKSLYNTAVSIQNHAPSADTEEGGLVFETCEAHDPSEYVVTLNVETARNDEAVLFRYWDDFLSSEEANKLSKSMAQVLMNFIGNSEALVSECDPFEEPIAFRNNDLMSPPIIPASNLGGPPKYESAPNGAPRTVSQGQSMDANADLKQMVDSCVHEVIAQMIKTGGLATCNADDMPNLVNRKVTEKLNISSQIKDEIKHPERKNEVTVSHAQIPDSIPIPERFEPWQAEEYNPKNDMDCQSRAARIKSDSRSAHVENQLLTVWCSLLEMDKSSIAREDSFFELGGDSLTAMKLVGAARDEGLSLTVADVFRNPIFEDMVALIMATYSQEEENINGYNAQTQAIRSAASSELYQRFSLVKATNIDAFLQSNICPKVGVFKGGIADVLPVTDFQALAITGSLLESRWMINYFFLDGTGHLDLRQLKLSCFKLIQSVDVLRTVFLPCGDRFLQAVLRKMRPEFNVYETDCDFDEFTETLHQRDRDQGFQLGEPFTNFTVVKERGGDRHRILIRLSHAQYDGVCMSTILHALKAGYEDEHLPTMSSFASYVRASAGTITSDHYQHWKALLRGSEMTDIVRRNGPNYQRSAGAISTLKQNIILSPIAHGSITPATVVKAAWALVLAQLSAKSDVVFGQTISGRNANIPNVESTVGPCLNVVPIRVRFGDKWTALDLLRYVQDQQVANMRYEALGFREITKHCTEWPDWTNFTTTVQHQNTGTDRDIRLGGNMYKIGRAGADEDFADFSVVSTPLDGDMCEISFSFSRNGEITTMFAQKVLQMLCNTASNFVADPNALILSPKELSRMPSQTIDAASTPPDNYFLSSQLQGINRADLMVLSDILSRAWRQVLGNEATNSLTLESSFFGLDGDIMGLAQVAWLLEQEGFKVRIEDLIDHATMLGQMAVMCSAKTQSKTSPTSSSSSLIDEDGPGKSPKADKSNSWVKAISMARKMVKRNTRTT